MDTKIFKGYMLVSDMDGTLIDSKGTISAKNISAINRFIEMGGMFTIATGRTVDSVKRYIDLLPLQLPFVIYNGSKIYDFSNEKTLYETFLEERIKDMIVKLADHESSLGIEVYCDEKIFIYRKCIFTGRLEQKGYKIYYEVPAHAWDRNWTKILIIGEQLQIDHIERTFKAMFGDCNLIRSSENYLEILPEGVSKGSGLEKLCGMVGASMKNVIAVGDNMNDYEMIARSGYGFCVANGYRKLLDMAQYKCPSNDEHAIEYVVNWAQSNLILKK
ncbi:Cof-like hydrolase [Peptoclostridium acidaminophilum DSM 3953]|uniref:Cof-like hydrolase n=1 Tax=Peptoclostridium acidaminophilum DSM 3953 TaxID=1286171 RepID=W8TGA9_PEPAC|nr:Cof-type HAD-IIB family hydrolase [Peptoclostridium acidaminophilum]AHM56868.1 Cof-like hydrolase [Peptoclostridium acidaminophilum DSM 3953]